MSVADAPPTSTDSVINFWMRALEDNARSAPPGIAEFLVIIRWVTRTDREMNRGLRLHGDPADDMEDFCQLIRLDTDCDGNLQAQATAVYIGLHLMSLLREVQIGLGRDEQRWEVVQAVLLLQRSQNDLSLRSR
jgi:hypothetical protein